MTGRPTLVCARRHFVLTETELLWFDNKADKEPDRRLRLQSLADVQTLPGDGKRWHALVHLLDDKGNKWELRWRSADEADPWVSRLAGGACTQVVACRQVSRLSEHLLKEETPPVTPVLTPAEAPSSAEAAAADEDDEFATCGPIDLTPRSQEIISVPRNKYESLISSEQESSALRLRVEEVTLLHQKLALSP